MSCNNLPDGCTQAVLDRAIGWDDDFEPELSDEELEAEYLEKIEASAFDAPPNVFYECAAPAPALSLTEGQRLELENFLEVLTAADLQWIGETIENLQTPGLYHRGPAATRKPATIDHTRLGYELATGRRA